MHAGEVRLCPSLIIEFYFVLAQVGLFHSFNNNNIMPETKGLQVRCMNFLERPFLQNKGSILAIYARMVGMDIINASGFNGSIFTLLWMHVLLHHACHSSDLVPLSPYQVFATRNLDLYSCAFLRAES